MSFRTTHPRLFRAVKFAAILSDGEAEVCLRQFRNGSDFAGEAVEHFGGVTKVVRAARNIYGNRVVRMILQIRTLQEAESAGFYDPVPCLTAQGFLNMMNDGQHHYAKIALTGATNRARTFLRNTEGNF